MNQPLASLMEGMRRALREDVLPELDSDHARTQLAGVLDVLSKLERMLVWSPDVLRARFATLEGVRELIAARCAQADYSPPPWSSVVLSPQALQSELEQAVRSSEHQLAALVDWLFEAPLPADLRADFEGLLCSALREALVAERHLVSRADFGAMTAKRR